MTTLTSTHFSTRTHQPDFSLIKQTGIYLCLLFMLCCVSANASNDKFTVVEATAAEAAELLKQDPEIRVLDVRTGPEYNHGHLEGSVNLNYYSRKFESELDKLDKNATWLVHCRSGVRSGKTLPLMKAAGFTNIIHLTDGIVDWVKAGQPVTKS